MPLQVTLSRIFIKNSTKRFKKGSENWAFGRPMANRKRIVQYSLNGDIIKIHDSINHAGRDLGTTPGNITSCCKGRYRTCKGFIFRYEQSTEDDEAILRENLSYKAGMKRAVQIFNKKGDLIIECKSIADAAKFIGAAETSVHLSFKNNRKYCKGYIIKKL